jgi:hypothetical protein
LVVHRAEFVIASEARQSMDRHVASLLAMTGWGWGAGLFVIASEARQSMDRHGASLLAMTRVMDRCIA